MMTKKPVHQNKDWEIKTLGDVCKKITDGSHFSPSTTDGDMPYVTVSDVSWSGEIDLDHCKKISKKSFLELVKNGCKPEKGDIMYSKDGTVGKAAMVNENNNFVVLSSLAILRPTKDLDQRFLYWAVQSPSFVKHALSSKTGAAIRRVVLKTIKTFEIPIPSLPEQKRIVKILDEKFGQIDELKKVAQQQIVDAKELFESRRKDFYDSCLEKSTTLDKISQNLDRKRIPITQKDRKPGNVPYYGASGVVDHVESHIFDEDLLLISEDGANLLARTYPIAFSISGKTWVNNHAHVLKFPDKISQKFIEYFINSISIKNYVTGAAQPKLNQKALNLILVPDESSMVKKKIVKELDELLEKTKELEAISLRKIADLEELKKSYLQEAFSGKL